MHESVQLVMLTLSGNSLGSTLTSGGIHLSKAAGATLITAIWQGAVVATCLALSLRFNKRLSAGLRFALWIAGFFAVLGLPFLPLLVKPDIMHEVLGSTSAGTAHPWMQLDERWSIGIALFWAVASMYRVVALAIHAARLRSLWQSATPMADRPPAPLKLWGRKPVEICTSNELDRPSVIGFFAPRILIPGWLLKQVTREELEQIVLHEMEHLRRGDDWTNLLQKLSLVVFPLNPALLWMERQLCLEREMACDEAVVRVTRAPKAYAACLTSLAERSLERRFEALSLGAWQRKPELVQRVQGILLRRQLPGPLVTRGVAIVMAGGLLMGTFELARCPQLVTFAPASHASLSARVLPAPKEIESGGDAVFHDSLRAMPVKSTGTGNARLVELRAVMPVPAGVPFTPSATAMRRPWNKRSRRVEPKPLTLRAPGDTLKADLGDGKSLSQQQSGPQSGFVVFTAWEEVVPQSDGNEPTIAADDSSSANAAPAVDATVHSGTKNVQMPGKVTVTQLVFRVVPASYRPSSQAIVPLRDGWLIIQL